MLSLQTGWGGRDRTYECRNQNPVPYHLATPQKTLVILRPQRMSLQAPRHKTAHVCRQLCQRPSGLNFTIECAKDTGPGSGHASVTKLMQPLKMTGHLRVTPAHHGFKIVVALADRKGGYCDCIRITCQFSGREDFRS